VDDENGSTRYGPVWTTAGQVWRKVYLPVVLRK